MPTQACRSQSLDDPHELVLRLYVVLGETSTGQAQSSRQQAQPGGNSTSLPASAAISPCIRRSSREESRDMFRSRRSRGYAHRALAAHRLEVPEVSTYGARCYVGQCIKEDRARGIPICPSPSPVKTEISAILKWLNSSRGSFPHRPCRNNSALGRVEDQRRNAAL
jgi:hypothetical protein